MHLKSFGKRARAHSRVLRPLLSNELPSATDKPRGFTGTTAAASFSIGLSAALAMLATDVHALDWRGNISSEITYFPESSEGIDNWNSRASIAADIEIFHDFSDNVALTVQPFVRFDQRDDERTHNDFSELILTTTGDSWDLSLIHI